MQIAALKIEQKNRGISDSDWRALLLRETGKASSTLLTDEERKRVYMAMTRPRSTPVASAPKTPTESKIWALWYELAKYLTEQQRNAAYLAGIVSKFGPVVQQGDNVRFDRLEPIQAYKAIEAIKQRITYEQSRLNADVPF